MRLDLHVHTNHSPDSWIPPAKLPLVAKRAGLHGVAVTDHSRFSACAEVRRAAKEHGILVVKGEEVGVKTGGRKICEIIGLFIEEEIDGAGKSPLEVIDAIRWQGGVVVMPHPFDRLRHILPEDELRELAVKVDAIEVFNSRAFDPQYNAKALEFAKEYGLAQTAGSDAHTTWEVGNAWTEADAKDLESFRKALLAHRTKVHGSYPFPLLRVAPKLAKLKNAIKRGLRL